MQFILEVWKMVFSKILLYLTILPVLSAATIWQNSTECAQAVTEFSQECTCFGSLAGWNAWQQTIVASTTTSVESRHVLIFTQMWLESTLKRLMCR